MRVPPATETPLFCSGRVTDFIDPLKTLASFLPTGHAPSLTFDSDAEFESVYEKATESTTLEDRIEFVKDLSRQLSEKIICVPLLERRWPVFYDSKRIAGVKTWGNHGLFKLQDVELLKR